ncbi:MAG: hypothetical protein SGJ21_04980 [Alphaproteobacteria bacterium]|nr:hypothetical protein [Alphaproteobacteria bacterium]
MTAFSASSPGDFWLDARTSQASLLPSSYKDGAPASDPSEARPLAQTEPALDTDKWPAWKVTVSVILFCGLFWAGVGYLVLRLLG